MENLCVARCRYDYGLRTSLAKEVEGQMSIITQFTSRIDNTAYGLVWGAWFVHTPH